MARKEATITIQLDGRDKGKQFHLREMSASACEEWAIRFFLALSRSDVSVPEEVAAAGLAGVAAMGPSALNGLKYEEAKPLLDEMMRCIQFVPDPQRPEVKRALIEDDIEEVQTRLFLKAQVFELHTGFSMAAALSPSAKTAAKQPATPNTQTSPAH